MTTFPRQSGTVSTATADVKPIIYAAKGDWVKHCTLIAQLYEERSLAEVMDFMERQHGFRATTKMYKTHIKKYGLDKKNKEHELRAIVRKHSQRAAQGKQSVFRIRGRIVDYEDVIRYWKRKGISIKQSIAKPRECATPEALECVTPVPSRIITPKALAIPEWIFASIGNYCKGSFGSGTWIITSPEFECQTVKAQRSISARSYELTNLCEIACELFAKNAFQEAGKALMSASAGIKDILLAEHPATLRNILRLITHVRSQQRYEIALAILRQFSALGEVVLGNEHPLRRMCGWLASVDLYQSEEVLSTCFRCIGDQLESLIGRMHFSTLRCRTVYIKHVYNKGDTSRAERLLRDVSNECEIALGPSDIRTLEVKMELAYHYLNQREKYIEAEKISLDIVTRVKHLRSRIKRIYFCADGLWILGNCQYARGDLYSANSNIRTAINLRVSEWGGDDSVVRLWRMQAERLQMQFDPVNDSNGSKTPVPAGRLDPLLISALSNPFCELLSRWDLVKHQ